MLLQTFCRLLLIKCSNEFENRRRATEQFGHGPLSEEEEEARAVAKAKMLGNIKFICELGRQMLVHENILHTCIKVGDSLDNRLAIESLLV